MNYVLTFLAGFFLVYLLIPGLRAWALKIGFVDRPTTRKNHKHPVPLFGGVGIFIGFICGYFLSVKPVEKEYFPVFVAGFMILIIGLFDDWYKAKGKEFPVLPRFIVHLAAAIIVYRTGIVFAGFSNPFTNNYIVLPVWLQFLLTVTWIFGVTTVINWSDGMDGLAGSLTAISGSTLFIVAMAKGQIHSALLSALLVGSVLGFLRYNKHPAQIFMGDSGANFLGFILSIIALEGAFKHATLISLFVPVLALGVPIFDNLFVVMRRLLERKPLYQADAGQIHHRLLRSGLKPKQVLTFVCLVNVCFSLLSIIILLLNV
ncbi:MAG: undecaprenyl/decaprenyl-phosphate alpha-N-acetylglucosaminyl 1-phosphate transferase [Firmicutes bacterium]|nr:undecaprenyl/decaprenyl-phosphate alpha-N-acetylglucosaminyl 1-phosphate transferase [Bacillota bacterium]